MPSSQDIAWSQLKVGILIVSALAILSAIIILVVGVESPFARRYTLYTNIPNIGGLRPSSPVLLDGVEAGIVHSYEFAELEKGVRIKLRILDKYQDRIRTDSVAKLTTLGLLGDKYVEINHGTSKARVLREGETIPGAQPVDFDQLITRGSHALENVDQSLANVKTLTQGMIDGQGTMGRLLQDDAMYKNANEVFLRAREGKGTLASALNDPTLYRELSAAASNLRKVSARIERGEGAAGKLLNNEEVAESLQSGIKGLQNVMEKIERGEGSLGRLSSDPALYNNLNKLAENLGPVSGRVSRGEGTVGRLFQDKELYDNTNQFVSELRLLIHDVRRDPKKYLRIKFSIF